MGTGVNEDLGLDVGGEVVGQQVVVAARGDGADHRLEEVVPPKLPAADEVCHPLVPGIQLHTENQIGANYRGTSLS